MAKHSEIKKLREAILEVLKVYPKARDSDQWLTLKIWQLYFPSRVVTLPDESIAIRFRDIMEMPREDNVKRLRAKIQNEEMLYLPTSWEVAKKRGIKEQQWKEYCLTH